jgi:hypothetical protein
MKLETAMAVHMSRPRPRLPIRRSKEVRADEAKARKEDEPVLSRGQIIVIFALFLFVLIGIMGLAIDLSYAWVNELRMQRAADASALAGAVYLPNDAPTGVSAGLAVARQNGYTNSGGVTVSVAQDRNPEQMDVSISAPVQTFFLRVFGIDQLNPTRSAHAQFHLPVPMGSPLNVFGDPNATDLSGHKLNFWAAVNAPCTLKEQGDPYATEVTTTSPAHCNSASVSNSEYKGPTAGDPGSYDYAVAIASGGTLAIDIYDPEFCDRQDQNFDTGDLAWSVSGGTNNFDTIFSLYDPTDTPYDLTSAHLNMAASYPGDSKTTAGGSCSSTYVTSSYDSNIHATSYTGKWIRFATVAAPKAGTYRISVQTQIVGNNAAYASNMFAIRATLDGASTPQVYAGLAGTQSAMSIYNNIDSGKAYVYLAKVSSAMANKTMEVDLFDPGEINGNAYLQFQEPDGSFATFSWRDAGTTLGAGGTVHSGVNSLQTANSGGGLFNGHWVVVTIKIPANYTAPNGGWWKIYYNMTATAHDRTTWRVSIIDSPVHLVP